MTDAPKTVERQRTKIAAVILAKDEERHIARCVDALREIATEIFVVDSLSTDRTAAVAKSAGAQVEFNAWVNYATQFNWALDHLPISSDWILRIDADEYFAPESIAPLLDAVRTAPEGVAGILVRRRIHFMGRWIRHGAVYPIWHLRLFRKGQGRCEQRWMDEHITLSRGAVVRSAADLIDDNLNSLTWWTAKHNGYASREAVDMLNARYRFLDGVSIDSASNPQAARKRFAKDILYGRTSPALRAFAYFAYRYFAKLGFLDGREGLIFHFLQGCWYRFLVDAKIAEVERATARGVDIKAAIQERLGISL